MTRYRLPEVLGGGEVDALERWGGCAGGRPEYRIEGITVTMPAGTPMEPVDTTPPEPEPGAWLIGERPFIRQSTEDDTIHIRRWLGAGFHVRTWQEVWDTAGGSGITPRRLVPEPAPVELPWAMEGGHATVQMGPTLRLAGGCDSLFMGDDEAIGLGRALITAGERSAAARAAREATT